MAQSDGDGETIRDGDMVFESGKGLYLDRLGKARTTGRCGEIAGKTGGSKRHFNYYRRITDPLHAAMVKALAAKQPDKSTG